MNKILELREKRAKAWDAAKAFLDSKRGGDGLLSAEDTAVYDKMEADVVALGKEIERLERQAAIDAELSKATSAPITNNPEKVGGAPNGIRASAEYRADFLNILRGKAPVNNVLSTSPDTDGGYLVPEELSARSSRGWRRPTSPLHRQGDHDLRGAQDPGCGHPLHRPVDGGERFVYRKQPDLCQKTIDAFKLTDLVKVSVELLQDSMFDLESYIAQEFARAFGVAEEEAFCVGTGTGQPTGIFTENGGTVGVTTSGASITVDNIIDLIYALKSPYRRNAVFLMRDVTVSALRKLKDTNGQYIWQPSVQAGQPDRLLGYPIYTSPYVPAVAAGALPIAFGDFSNYWIADRMGRTVQRLNELYAGNGQVGFIAAERVDGKVILAEGIQLLQMGS
jgi:predicted phage gp36 major capsid-like protein